MYLATYQDKIFQNLYTISLIKYYGYFLYGMSQAYNQKHLTSLNRNIFLNYNIIVFYHKIDYHHLYDYIRILSNLKLFLH